MRARDVDNKPVHVGAVGGQCGVSLAIVLVALASARAPDSRAEEVRAAAPSSEATSSAGLQEIIVTAQRRQENIQSVPISVSSITDVQLESSGIKTVMDLPILTSGLNTNRASGYFQPRLRGVGTTADSATVESPVAMYVDGVYVGHEASSLIDFVNVERIEVDKGPQGTLFGRNATGGLIQIITRDPRAEFGGEASVGYGNYGTFTGNGYLTGPITPDLAADFAVHFENQRQGYGTNFYNGDPTDRAKRSAVRSKWLFTPSNTTRATAILDYAHDDGTPTLYPFPGTLSLGTLPPGFNAVHPRDVLVAASYRDKGDWGGGSLKVEHDFDFATLTSTSAYRKTKYKVDFPNTTPDPNFIANPILNDKYSQASQEFQLASRAGSRLIWVAGTYLYYADAGWRPLTLSGGIFGPVSIDFNTTEKTYSAAAYGQVTTEIFRNTNLTLGLRETYDRKKWEGSQSLSFAGIPIPGTSVSDSENKTFNKLTWRAAIDHHFNDDVMAYASLNRGFKSGGFNDTIIPGSVYAPETLDAYELGLKSTVLDRHLRLNGAVFYYDYKNVQVTRYVFGNIEIYNGAAARIYGVDLDAEVLVTDNFKFTSGVEFLHDRYTSFPNADFTVPGPSGGSIYSQADASGHRLSYTPDTTFDIAASYKIPVSFGEFNFTASYYHNGGWYANPDQRLHQAAYNVVNTTLNWQSVDDKFEIQLWARNLNNALFAVAATEQGLGDVIQYAPPRTFGMTATVKFGGKN